MTKKIKTKYFNFIQDCYHHQTFDKLLLRDIHKVGFTLLRAMSNTNTIKTKGGVTAWIAGPLTQDLVNGIYREYNQLKRIEERNRLKKKTHEPKQLTIQPLKRVASIVEPPVQTIDLHEESQLTWTHLLIIFAAGIIAGGLIATIWK